MMAPVKRPTGANDTDGTGIDVPLSWSVIIITPSGEAGIGEVSADGAALSSVSSDGEGATMFRVLIVASVDTLACLAQGSRAYSDIVDQLPLA